VEALLNSDIANKLELIREVKTRRARLNFYEFRKLMNPKMLEGWWQKLVADSLQEFTMSLIAGEKPRPLIVQAPPQHGKSELIIDLIAWVSGLDPNIRTIYTSFSERLGIRANLKLQRIYTSSMYKSIFEHTKIKEIGVADSVDAGIRNKEMLQYLDKDGFFRNTTVRGSITGHY
jgi:hypothetical protein